MKKKRSKIGLKKRRGFGLKFLNSKVRKTLPYQLLILSLIVLVVLILIWVVLFALGMVDYFPKGDKRGLEGGLGTLCIFCDENPVILEVLDPYVISSDNQTIDVNIDWKVGTILLEDFESIFIRFIRTGEDCNHTISSGLPGFGTNITYQIDSVNTNCGSGNFSNVTNVLAYAEVDLPLTQTELIDDIKIYNDDPLANVVDLDDYFHCLKKINFSVVGDVDDKTGIEINNATNIISFNPRIDWYDAYVFNLSAFCGGDVLDVSNSGANMSFKVIVIDDDEPVQNEAPDFRSSYCDNLVWRVNTNFRIDLEKCFEDDDDDALVFRYANVSGYNDNLTISRNRTNLTLIPDNNWIGDGYFYVYANDSIEETRGKVDFEVYKNTTTAQRNTTRDSDSDGDDFEIKTPSPSGSVVTVFHGSDRTFSIRNTDYETIRWFLDGKLVASDVKSYKIDEDLDIDVYVVRVVITNSEGDSVEKTWNLRVEKGGPVTESIFDTGEVIFYTIISVIVLIIILIVWLFIAEKNSKKNKINYLGFGVSQPSRALIRVKGSEKNLFGGDGPNRFNLPG